MFVRSPVPAPGNAGGGRPWPAARCPPRGKPSPVPRVPSGWGAPLVSRRGGLRARGAAGAEVKERPRRAVGTRPREAGVGRAAALAPPWPVAVTTGRRRAGPGGCRHEPGRCAASVAAGPSARRSGADRSGAFRGAAEPPRRRGRTDCAALLRPWHRWQGQWEWGRAGAAAAAAGRAAQRGRWGGGGWGPPPLPRPAEPSPGHCLTPSPFTLSFPSQLPISPPPRAPICPVCWVLDPFPLSLPLSLPLHPLGCVSPPEPLLSHPFPDLSPLWLCLGGFCAIPTSEWLYHAFLPFCVCADTGDADEFANEQQKEGPDNLFAEQLTETASAVALEGSRWFERPKCSRCRPYCHGG